MRRREEQGAYLCRAHGLKELEKESVGALISFQCRWGCFVRMVFSLRSRCIEVDRIAACLDRVFHSE